MSLRIPPATKTKQGGAKLWEAETPHVKRRQVTRRIRKCPSLATVLQDTDQVTPVDPAISAEVILEQILAMVGIHDDTHCCLRRHDFMKPQRKKITSPVSPIVEMNEDPDTITTETIHRGPSTNDILLKSGHMTDTLLIRRSEIEGHVAPFSKVCAPFLDWIRRLLSNLGKTGDLKVGSQRLLVRCRRISRRCWISVNIRIDVTFTC